MTHLESSQTDAALRSIATLVSDLVALDVLGPLDRRFAELLVRLDPAAESSAVVASALVFAARERGHVCLDLGDGAQRALLGPTLEARTKLDEALAGCEAALARASFVRGPESSLETPLVLEGRRLYLDRLYLAEVGLVSAIHRRLEDASPPERDAVATAALQRLFDRPAGSELTDQMRAALLASRSRFSIVTGGPGTGKTTTVVRILALLLEAEPGLRVRLLAPTGKAAARLSESIRTQLAALDSPAREAIPADASTIHRALGIVPDRPSRARHDARSPLPCDVLVVDEASMVDLELMARLFAALSPSTRIILLGDRDQLASVEAGAVLGDLCGIRDSVAMLERSRRFDPERGIGRLAAAVRVGDELSAREALRSGDGVAYVDLRVRREAEALEKRVADVFARLSRESDPRRALERIDALRVLCAVRRGEDGVIRWNERIAARLVNLGLVPRGRPHYHGRPILVTANDYDVQLYNGDVGVELVVDGSLRACFPDPRAALGYRMVSLARLPSHETVYAMTIHKSQGSEVDEVVLVLPREESRVLGRELVYTGITRARRQVTLAGPVSTFERSLKTTVARASGLREKLSR